MFRILESEMIKNRVDKKDISEAIAASERTVRKRFAGTAEWKLDEMETIRDTFFPEKDLDELFKRDKAS